MRQEDFNSMMKNPGETNKPKQAELAKCPSCGYSYLGDGISLCLECAHNKETK